MKESEPHKLPQEMWGLSSETARLRLLNGLSIPEDSGLPLDDFSRRGYADLPEFIKGRLLVAATPDGWKPEVWQNLVREAQKAGVFN